MLYIRTVRFDAKSAAFVEQHLHGTSDSISGKSSGRSRSQPSLFNYLDLCKIRFPNIPLLWEGDHMFDFGHTLLPDYEG